MNRFLNCCFVGALTGAVCHLIWPANALNDYVVVVCASTGFVTTAVMEIINIVEE